MRLGSGVVVPLARPTATAPIRPLAWDPLYAAGAALGKDKRQKEKKKNLAGRFPDLKGELIIQQPHPEFSFPPGASGTEPTQPYLPGSGSVSRGSVHLSVCGLCCFSSQRCRPSG